MWDATPEAQFRYRARIPLDKMKGNPSPYRVIDYLIVVPDPRAMTGAELDAFMEPPWREGDLATVGARLEAEQGRLRWFLDTSWDVKAEETW